MTHQDTVYHAASVAADVLIVALVEDIAQNLTKREAQALAALYEALGRHEDAEAILLANLD